MYRIDLSELTARQTFDKDKDGAVTEEEAKFFTNDNEELDFDNFLEKGWKRFNLFDNLFYCF